MSGTTSNLVIFEIPLIAGAQKFMTTLAGIQYEFELRYRQTDQGGWTLDISDSNKNPLVCGIPLVTGEDLLQQYKHLSIGGPTGSIRMYTDGDPTAVPTYENLGGSCHMYFAAP